MFARLLFSLLTILTLTIPVRAETLVGLAAVVDGDTLELRNSVVRLSGIDTPEMGQFCTNGAGREYACGEQAKAALTRLVAGGPVTCRGSETGRYRRLIASCRAGGLDLGAEMTRLGWALAFRRYSVAYVGQEAAARDARRGLWSGEFVMPWEARARRRSGSPAPVEAGRLAGSAGCAIKGNISRRGRIYHAPGSRAYALTRIDEARGERWFCSEAEARAAGWRAPRR